MPLWPGGDQRPVPRSVSNRRHGAPAPPSPSMRAARRSRAVWLCFRAPPVDRQHPAGRLRQPRAGLDTARRRPDRPGSSYIGAQTGLRAAFDPPALPLARSCGPLSPAQARSGGAQPPVGRPSALGQVRFGPQPAPGGPRRRLSGPPAAAQAAPQPPAPTRQGPPAPTPRPPAQFPAGAGTRAHIYARACGVEIFRKKNPRE